MAGSIVSVSVDLDEIACYHAIHGLDEPGMQSSRIVFSCAVPRFIELFDRYGIRATFFVVGSSLDSELGAKVVQNLDGCGHEVANHTHTHPYDLLRLEADGRAKEIDLGARAIEKITDKRPVGFRAPGYNVDSELIDLLISRGYIYDSSVFPCPTYYSAKAGLMATMRLCGRRSRSLLGPVRTLLAPTEPYRIARGQSFWRSACKRASSSLSSSSKLTELPIALIPGLRIPFIGTSLTLAGPRLATIMTKAMTSRRFIGLELHGIDLLDTSDGLSSLASYQPDLSEPLERKLTILEAVFRTLIQRGSQLIPCIDAARLVA